MSKPTLSERWANASEQGKRITIYLMAAWLAWFICVCVASDVGQHPQRYPLISSFVTMINLTVSVLIHGIVCVLLSPVWASAKVFDYLLTGVWQMDTTA
jgi:hypothetical protein